MPQLAAFSLNWFWHPAGSQSFIFWLVQLSQAIQPYKSQVRVKSNTSRKLTFFCKTTFVLWLIFVLDTFNCFLINSQSQTELQLLQSTQQKCEVPNDVVVKQQRCHCIFLTLAVFYFFAHEYHKNLRECAIKSGLNPKNNVKNVNIKSQFNQKEKRDLHRIVAFSRKVMS